jgi:hypothetical protein
LLIKLRKNKEREREKLKKLLKCSKRAHGSTIVTEIMTNCGWVGRGAKAAVQPLLHDDETQEGRRVSDQTSLLAVVVQMIVMVEMVRSREDVETAAHRGLLATVAGDPCVECCVLVEVNATREREQGAQASIN